MKQAFIDTTLRSAKALSAAQRDEVARWTATDTRKARGLFARLDWDQEALAGLMERLYADIDPGSMVWRRRGRPRANGDAVILETSLNVYPLDPGWLAFMLDALAAEYGLDFRSAIERHVAFNHQGGWYSTPPNRCETCISSGWVEEVERMIKPRRES